VTGSGKTEVYLQAIDRVLKQGKGAIVLVPEIALTPQTVERFVGRFGRRVAVLHSHLSQGERHDEWHRVRDGKADIVIGARSAVFAPMPNLGLIVVDEEHEPSYKQEDAPRYNARDVAVMRGHLQPCAVILGSATPSLESWHNARVGKYRLAVLPHRADNRKMPAVGVVDMRIETQRAGHPSVLSKELIEAIRCRLDRAEQTILFLNRRGYSSSLICPKCGYVAQCDQCSVSYTYHRSTEELRCHICGGNRKVPAKCPSCQDPAFKFAGMGTQRVEAIIRKCFPHARIQRMDTDVTGCKDAYERILGDFRVGKIDILVGTQMIAKGLHFPNVTLVGVVYADLSLHMPDFRAGERSFQLLAQVAGRAGRGEVSGEVLVQTYTPHHVAIQTARRADYEAFCDQELEFRRELGYPPYSHLICVTLRGRSSEQTLFFTSALAKKLKPLLPSHVRVSDPAPAPLARAKGYYRFQIMLRSKSTRAMTEPIRKALAGFTMPRAMSCSVDVDAMALL
jgi:primosomal protein N' (replication factor Y)